MPRPLLLHASPNSSRGPARPAQCSFWRCLADAIAESNKRRAEREIARYLGGAGAKFTDETEREIKRRFLANSTVPAGFARVFSAVVVEVFAEAQRFACQAQRPYLFAVE